MTLNMKPFCKACSASPLASHPCPDCGIEVGGSNSYPCMSCAIKRTNIEKLIATKEILTNPQVRQLYSDFTQWCNDSGRANKLASAAPRYLQFLVKLDVALQQQSGPLDKNLIVQVFSTEEIRQMGLLSQHLVESGLLIDDGPARRRRSDKKLLDSKVDAISDETWAVDITQFLETLSNRAKPLTLRSQKAYVHAAISLLKHAAVTRASHISQGALDGLVNRKPGLQASLSAFLAYLSSIHGTNLKLDSKLSKPVPMVRHAKYVRSLLDALKIAPERPARLALTARLLAKLLNARLEVILRLRHSDLDLKDFRSVKLRGSWVELPESFWPMLAELPSRQWRDGLDADPLLFQGRFLMDGLSNDSVRYHVNTALLD